MGVFNFRRSGCTTGTAANNSVIDLERLTAGAAPMATTSRPEESLPPYPGNIHPSRTIGTEAIHDASTYGHEGQTNSSVRPGETSTRLTAVERRERRMVWRQRARRFGVPIVTFLLILGVIFFVGGVVLPAIRRMQERQGQEQGEWRVDVVEG